MKNHSLKKFFLSALLLCFALPFVSACGNSSSSASSAAMKRKYLSVPYTETTELKETDRLDLRLPSKGEGPFPLVIYIHGGGWYSLARDYGFFNVLFDDYLASGYAVALVDYHLDQITSEDVVINGETWKSQAICTKTAWPQMIYDVKCAIRHLRANASTYHLDTNNFFLLGESAGGHLSLLSAATEGEADHTDLTMGYKDVSSSVNAVLSFFAPSMYDLTCSFDQLAMLAMYGKEYTEDEWKFVSPYYHVKTNQKMLPLYITHGEADVTVPSSQSHQMEALVRSVIGDDKVESRYFDGVYHADYAVFNNDTIKSETKAFMKKYTVAA